MCHYNVYIAAIKLRNRDGTSYILLAVKVPIVLGMLRTYNLRRLSQTIMHLCACQRTQLLPHLLCTHIYILYTYPMHSSCANLQAAYIIASITNT